MKHPENPILVVLLDTVEHALLTRFSFGARLPELRSIALIVAQFAGLHRPSRDSRRTYARMLGWFSDNWESISPWLECMHLRDDDDRIVNASREFCERCKAGNLWF
jgi:hypothetical protein